MPMPLDTIAVAAMQLPPAERRQLIRRLAISLEGSPEDSPEATAKAWDEEIARRAAGMDAGRTQWIPADEAVARVRDRIREAKVAHAESPLR